MKTSEQCAMKELISLQRTGYQKRAEETKNRASQGPDPLPQLLGIYLGSRGFLRAKNRHQANKNQNSSDFRSHCSDDKFDPAYAHKTLSGGRPSAPGKQLRRYPAIH
jgi:hypothetical protein